MASFNSKYREEGGLCAWGGGGVGFSEEEAWGRRGGAGARVCGEGKGALNNFSDRNSFAP